MGDSEISGNIGFIGAGNMAWAVGAGLVKTGVVQASQVFVSAPSGRNLGRWKEIGMNTSQKNGFVVENADFIFLAVKPLKLDDALEDTRKSLEKNVSNKLFISLLAGVKISVIHNKVNDVVPKSRVIRVMPNTPIMVGVGTSAYCRGPTASDEDLKTVHRILSVGGLCEEVPEHLLDAVTGVSGCGPAYVYIIIEAMADGAVKMGIPRETATKFAAQTVMGAARMVLETGKHPGQLKDEVCSPGGTTISAVHAMEKAGVRSALIDAVEAATKRSIELGEKY